MGCMDAGVYRRGVAELDYRQGRGGAGTMSKRERNRRAREYSARCRRKRLERALGIAALVLWAALLTALWWMSCGA